LLDSLLQENYLLLVKMDKYREEQISQLESKYYKDLPRVKKLASFYSRATIQSPNSSVLLDQDPTDSSPILTLLCPITRARQTVPVRTTACQHVETFDLYNFLHSISSKTLLLNGVFKTLLPGLPTTPHSVPHSCPICRCKGPLYIDSLISSALTLFSSEILQVSISPSGLLFTPPTHPAVNKSIIDLATPTFNTSMSDIPPPPELDCSPESNIFCVDGGLSKPQQVEMRNGFARRTFSFGDSCMYLGTGGVGRERYNRLSTVDLSSPC